MARAIAKKPTTDPNAEALAEAGKAHLLALADPTPKPMFGKVAKPGFFLGTTQLVKDAAQTEGVLHSGRELGSIRIAIQPLQPSTESRGLASSRHCAFQSSGVCFNSPIMFNIAGAVEAETAILLPSARLAPYDNNTTATSSLALELLDHAP